LEPQEALRVRRRDARGFPDEVRKAAKPRPELSLSLTPSFDLRVVGRVQARERRLGATLEGAAQDARESGLLARLAPALHAFALPFVDVARERFGRPAFPTKTLELAAQFLFFRADPGHVSVEARRMSLEAPVLQLPDRVDAVEQLRIVRHDEPRSAVAVEETPKLGARPFIQVVRRFVQEQRRFLVTEGFAQTGEAGLAAAPRFARRNLLDEHGPRARHATLLRL